ncbi:MAG TPA: 3-isopropylmalate dehydratase [Anaerolineaceae bacterium]|nr:3-isopropylmalate dehydratase [Anaerolineaceae bacterium]
MTRVWKFGSDVDTDQIVPGRYAPYMRPAADVGEAAFIEARPDFARNAQPGDLIVAEENFGCGSSREYAVEALKRRQVGAIVALSFARIFYRNALNLGIPLFESPEIVAGLADGDRVRLDIRGKRVLVEREDGTENEYPLPELPKFAQDILDEGGIVPYMRKYGRFPGQE